MKGFTDVCNIDVVEDIECEKGAWPNRSGPWPASGPYWPWRRHNNSVHAVGSQNASLGQIVGNRRETGRVRETESAAESGIRHQSEVRIQK